MAAVKAEITVKYRSRCRGCGRTIEPGEIAQWLGPRLGVAHGKCAQVKLTVVAAEFGAGSYALRDGRRS